MLPTPPAIPVYLLPPDHVTRSLPPLAGAGFEELRAAFALQAHTAHTLAPDPESAEIILAPIQVTGYGRCFETLRRSPIYRKFAAKLLVYCLDSNQFPALRGLYPGAQQRWIEQGWALPAHYISTHYHKFLFAPDELQHKDVLFSFVGSSRTHPLREKIVQWQDKRGVVIDSSSKNDQQYWWERPEKDHFSAMFREVTRRSKFVVCPRGKSPASVRVFETMEAAAVPVIVADDLELPLGPRWEEFSLRVREQDVDKIPNLIERRQDRAEAMGKAARAAWEAYFSPQATVGSVVGWAQLLLARSHRCPLHLRLQEYTDFHLLKGKLRSRAKAVKVGA